MFSLLLPSHNLHHVVSMFSFQGTSELVCSKKSSLEDFVQQTIYVNSFSEGMWWAKVDSNHRPHDYQSCALAS